MICGLYMSTMDFDSDAVTGGSKESGHHSGAAAPAREAPVLRRRTAIGLDDKMALVASTSSLLCLVICPSN